MSSVRRQSFTAQQKLKIIAVAEEFGNREAGRRHDVDESCVRLWRKNKDSLQAAHRDRRSFRGPKTGAYPELEVQLVKFIEDVRSRGHAVSTEMAQVEARRLSRELGLPHGFRASRGWLHRFMKRQGLSIRRRTTICQRLPASYEEKLLKYQRYVIGLRKQHDYIFSQIGNADETPVYFEMPLDTTIEKTGSSSVSVLTGGNTKLCVTVLLCALADGTQLRPYVILKRKTLPKIHLPAGVVVRAHENAWMNSDLFVDWVKTVWEKRPGAMLAKRSMLVLDSFRGHTTEEVKDRLSRNGTDLVVIPGGMTSMLQPLDVSLNKPFKAHVKRYYAEWMAEGLYDLTPTGRVRRPDIALFCKWIVEAWKAIPGEMVRKSFKKCCITNNMDGTEDDLVHNSEDCGSSDSSSESSDSE